MKSTRTSGSMVSVMGSKREGAVGSRRPCWALRGRREFQYINNIKTCQEMCAINISRIRFDSKGRLELALNQGIAYSTIQLKPNLDGGGAGGEGRTGRISRTFGFSTSTRSYTFYHCTFLHEHGLHLDA